MDKRLITLFNVALRPTIESERVDFAVLNKVALVRGYLVHPDACTNYVYNWVMEQTTNYNATFYKDWADILEKSRFELFIDQLKHYASTYGTDFQGEPYIPNTGAENVPPIDMKNVKVILPVTEDELYTRCMNMLSSGIALRNDVVDTLVDYVCSLSEKRAAKGIEFDVDVDSVKNKEALVAICSRLGIAPSDKFNLLRYIVYVTTGDAMIINNRDFKNRIIESEHPFDFEQLTEDGLSEMSSIFYRYKDIFVAFKRNQNLSKESRHAINRLRRLAVKNHKPMKSPFWTVVLGEHHTREEIVSHLGELNNFKKVALMQTIQERLQNPDANVYIIRNQRTFVRKLSETERKVPESQKAYLMSVYGILRESLVESLSKKATTVKFHEDIDVKCPTSEKNFIGNYPIGTAVNLGKNAFIGVYWRGEWGTRDFDLHAYGLDGSHYGWNASYNGCQLVYSGDMTTANPEASEIFSTKDKISGSRFTVNRFSGEEGSKFRLFVGVTKGSDINKYARKGYMADPNDVLLNVEMVSTDRETTLGFADDGIFYLTDMKTGYGRVPAYQKELTANMLRKAKCYISLQDILADAGFTAPEVHEDGTVDEPVLDITNLNKDTLIELFS